MSLPCVLAESNSPILGRGRQSVFVRVNQMGVTQVFWIWWGRERNLPLEALPCDIFFVVQGNKPEAANFGA